VCLCCALVHSIRTAAPGYSAMSFSMATPKWSEPCVGVRCSWVVAFLCSL
jgi:hypothetical protein